MHTSFSGVDVMNHPHSSRPESRLVFIEIEDQTVYLLIECEGSQLSHN